MKNANKKKWSEMTKKERFWKIFGLVIRLLALAAALAVTISLWVSARRSTPLSASAETVDVPLSSGLFGTVYQLGNSSTDTFVPFSGFFDNVSVYVDDPLDSSNHLADVLDDFESYAKNLPGFAAGGFYPVNILFTGASGRYSLFWYGINYGSNGVIRYVVDSALKDVSGTQFDVPILSNLNSSSTSLWEPLGFFVDSKTNIWEPVVRVPQYVTSSIQGQLIITFLNCVVYENIVSPGNGNVFSYRNFGESLTDSDSYRLGYSSGYNAASSDGVSYNTGYQSGYDAGVRAAGSSNYSNGYKEGQSAGYISGYDDGLAAGQLADKNVNLDWVINSVGGLFNIKMGTGQNALTFGDIVFTMVSISIFGGVLKLFFGG